MTIKVLVTLGPSSMTETIVREIAKQGVHLFRVNLSHTKLQDVEKIISDIQSWTDIPVCLDSEGAQVRNQGMVKEDVFFECGTRIKIHHEEVCGDSGNISFTPRAISRQFEVGDVINVDFNAVRLRISSLAKNYLVATVEHGGHVGSNKAADVNRDLDLEAITPKDKAAFEIGLENGVENFSLSFTNSSKDVAAARAIIGENANLISKIESVKGILNLDEILPVVDQILIDRGDLSREVPIEKIPFIQRRIISYARSKNVPVFVATNLLEGMIKTKLPTRADVNDVASTMLMGASGLVLAAETAIGAYPIDAVKMINSLIEQYEQWTPESSLTDVLNS